MRSRIRFVAIAAVLLMGAAACGSVSAETRTGPGNAGHATSSVTTSTVSGPSSASTGPRVKRF
jgi:hypothetical protein